MQQTSAAKLAAFFEKFLKKVPTLRVNKTKVTLRDTFTSNLFALESKKESKNDERTPFRDCLRILDLSVYRWSLIARFMWSSERF